MINFTSGRLCLPTKIQKEKVNEHIKGWIWPGQYRSALGIGMPGEPFTDVVVQIKNTEGWSAILPCCIVNGYEGYFPTKEAYDEGGYESRASNYQPDVPQRIIDGGKELLAELKKQ